MTHVPEPQGFLHALATGRLDWERLRGAPGRDAGERQEGERVAAEIAEFLEKRVDPDEVDRTGELPAGLLDEIRGRGYFKLRNDEAVGGLALGSYEALRVIERASRHSVAVGQLIAIPNAVGASALIPALPEGRVRDFVTRRVAEGAISGFGVTEAAGQNNAWTGMTATRAPDGSGHVLRGEKLFTGNGPVADLLAVAATEGEGAERRLVVAFVDTADSPGFRVASEIGFVGSKGLPNAALRFDDVYVPADRVLRGEPGDPRMSAAMRSVVLTGQLYFTAAPAMAVARQCLLWTREFIDERTIDGRGLGAYDLIQRIAATTRAEVYAMESVLERSLAGEGADGRWFERMAAKNLSVGTAWRIVDRTVSLFGGAGLETVASKRRRGASPVPLERAFRDARGLRVAGNVDFQLDQQLGRRLLTECFLTPGEEAAPLVSGSPQVPGDDDLSPANLAHLSETARQVHQLYGSCRELVADHADPDDLFRNQEAVALVARIAAELFAVSAVLARAGRASGEDGGGEQALADVHCTAAWHRVAGLRRALDACRDTGSRPDYSAISHSQPMMGHDS
ncbi:acyl-CoA dehydrogenase family protein [Streptomyces beijiangensis]|uniref:Acyl-CoA/acyl-ACP dehydrogenase n=1 Tax=Streptomyces beijiangensis TaxID=163361 RepID=A0A939F8F5_9ACTN|nr:acyl-CoA dehydrogenase family protein [Streptomyces beijiangensis]MBO0513488.1 acyl-CoA/acyl-ACP dehydrogenase [Streptomyces beijiangensis]